MAADERERANWRSLRGTKWEYSNPEFEARELAKLIAEHFESSVNSNSLPWHSSLNSSSLIPTRLVRLRQDVVRDATPLARRLLSLLDQERQDENANEVPPASDDFD